MDNVIDVQNLFREYKQTRNLFKRKQQSIKAVMECHFQLKEERYSDCWGKMVPEKQQS